LRWKTFSCIICWTALSDYVEKRLKIILCKFINMYIYINNSNNFILRDVTGDGGSGSCPETKRVWKFDEGFEFVEDPTMKVECVSCSRYDFMYASFHYIHFV
jgi:hypothetical protein